MAEKRLTHIAASGEAHMVDVGGKAETERTAIAEATVTMLPATLKTILAGDAKKGDVLGAARIAGIMAAKKTHELIPLCHPLLLTKVAVDIEPDEALPGLCEGGDVWLFLPEGEALLWHQPDDNIGEWI